MVSLSFRFLRIAYLCIVLTIATIAASCGRSESDKLEGFLLDEIARHPLSTVQDIYKLLYQGSFGVGHILRNRDDARVYLHSEISGLQPVGKEPMLEPCNPDQSIVRVNLRPFIARGFSNEKLVDAMMLSAELLHPDTSAFTKQWDFVGELIRVKKLPFREDEYRSFSKKLTTKKYLPFHQSESYSRAYKPAYRVVLRRVFSSFFPNADD